VPVESAQLIVLVSLRCDGRSDYLADLGAGHMRRQLRSSTLQSRKVITISARHCEEGWRLHQPAELRQGGFHDSGMWPFRRQI